MYKKVLALGATALIASTVTAAASAVVNFNDIYESFAQKDIISLVEKGIVQGRGDGTFDPKASVTREEEAAMLNRLLTYLEGIRKEDAALLTKKLEELEKLAKENSTVYVPVNTTPPAPQPPTPVDVDPTGVLAMEDLSDGGDGWNVGFNFDQEAIPYSSIASITVSLTGVDGAVLATRTATGAQIDALRDSDILYGGIDGQLSAYFKQRDAADSNEYWNSSAYDLTAPIGSKVVIVAKDGSTYTVTRNI